MYGISIPIIWPALIAAEKYIHPLKDHLSWIPANDMQAGLITDRAASLAALSGLGDELMSYAAPTAEEVNRFLAEAGLDIRLDPWTDPDTIGMAAVLKILKKAWQAKVGHNYEFADGREAYTLRPDERGMRLTTVLGHIVTTVPLESGWEITFVSGASNETGYGLIGEVSSLKAMAVSSAPYGGVMLPSLLQSDVRPDMDWLLNLRTVDKYGGPWRMVQAVEQIKLAFGPMGVSAVAGFAGASMLECCISHRKPESDIYPYDMGALWSICRTGHNIPVIAGSFNREDTSEIDVDVNELDW